MKLSKGVVLKRFFILQNEINIFISEKSKNLLQLSNKKLIPSVAFIKLIEYEKVFNFTYILLLFILFTYKVKINYYQLICIQI